MDLIELFLSCIYYSVKSCTVLEIRNGKIIADISYFDQVAFLRQVGFFDKH